jgi:ASF1 like histone chaperone
LNNDYMDEQMRLEPPETPKLELLQRSILADKPRVTRFSIPWYAVTNERDQVVEPTPEVSAQNFVFGQAPIEQIVMKQDTPIEATMDIEI